MKRKCLFLIGLLVVGVLSGCSMSNDKKSDEVVISTFEADANTLSKEEENQVALQQAMSNAEVTRNEGYDPNEHVGQLVIESTNSNQDFEVSGNDVVNNGVVYHDMYSNISNISSPYDANTMINFILETYEAKANEIYTNYIDYNVLMNQEVAEGEDNTIFTPDDILAGNPKYDNLVEQYGETATWELSVYSYGGENKGTMYGCSSYIVFIGTDSDITIKL